MGQKPRANYATIEVTMNASIQIGFYAERPDEITLNIYLSGCRNNKKCDMRACHNQLMRRFDYGTDIRLLYPRIERVLREGMVDSVVLLGGEPFDQDIKELHSLVAYIQSIRPNISIHAYTGYEYDEVAGMARLLGIESICAGPYVNGIDTKRWYRVTPD